MVHFRINTVKRFLIIFGAIAFLLGNLKKLIAQNTPQPYFQNYSTEEGLPSPEIHCIFQDSKGYIWIGTDNGVARFDGYEFKNYAAKDGLTKNVVFGIQEDSKGRIWLSTMSGETFIFENETIKPYQYNEAITKYRGKYFIAKLKHIDKEDNAYFQLEKYGILIISKDGKQELIEPYDSQKRNIVFYGVDDVIISSYRSPIKTSTNSGEIKIVVAPLFKCSLQFIERNKKDIILESKEIKNRDNFGTEKCGIYLNPKKTKKIYYFSNELCFIENDTIKWQIPFNLKINRIDFLSNNHLLFSTKDKQGLVEFQNIENLKKNIYKQYLDGHTIHYVYEDRNNGIWVGTKEKGVYYCANFKNRAYEQIVGKDQFISTICKKDEKNLYLGSSAGDIIELNTKTHEIKNVYSDDFLKGQYNHVLKYDESSDIVWTSNGYIKDHQIGYLFRDNFIIPRKLEGVRDILLSHSRKEAYVANSAWIGKYNMETMKWKYNSWDLSIQDFRKPFTLYEDHKNQILVGREDGIFTLTNDNFIPFIDDPFLQTRIEDIDQLSNHIYILGTKGKGVVLWKDTIQQTYTENDGLASDMIEKIHVVNDTIWVATLSGLSRIVQGANKEVRTFNISTGLPSNEIYDIESNNGKIWLATAKGLVKFQEVPENKFSLPPYLSSIQIGEAFFNSDTTASVNYQQNNIRVDYVTFNYKQQGRIPYRYRLHSNDKWIETKSTTALFTDLRPNNYMFEIQSQNEDGYWSESSVFPFCIKPAWYATWWFMGLSIVVVSGFIYWRFKRLAKQSAKELALQKEKLKLMDQEVTLQAQIRDLERSALQAQMNPHFIFNCLNSIQNFIIENDQKNAVKYLAKFAHLTRQILNLSIDGKVNLVQEIQLLENYLSLEKLRFKNKFDYQIKIEPQINQEEIEIPPLLVQPFIENAIIHGMGSRAVGGRIEVDFTQSDDFLRISVFDNGLESVHHLKEIESKHKFKSVGMNITKKRLALLNEADENDMIQFEEIRDENKNRVGTKVSIAIKI